MKRKHFLPIDVGDSRLF